MIVMVIVVVVVVVLLVLVGVMMTVNKEEALCIGCVHPTNSLHSTSYNLSLGLKINYCSLGVTGQLLHWFGFGDLVRVVLVII